MTSIGARTSSPRRITDPFPYCLSICASAASSAFSRSSVAIVILPSSVGHFLCLRRCLMCLKVLRCDPKDGY